MAAPENSTFIDSSTNVFKTSFEHLKRSRYWTYDEHERFIEAQKRFKGDDSAVSGEVFTRSTAQRREFTRSMLSPDPDLLKTPAQDSPASHASTTLENKTDSGDIVSHEISCDSGFSKAIGEICSISSDAMEQFNDLKFWDAISFELPSSIVDTAAESGPSVAPLDVLGISDVDSHTLEGAVVQDTTADSLEA